jgi:hypothetical protein
LKSRRAVLVNMWPGCSWPVAVRAPDDAFDASSEAIVLDKKGRSLSFFDPCNASSFDGETERVRARGALVLATRSVELKRS